MPENASTETRDAANPSLWHQHDLTYRLTGRARDILLAVVAAGWCPLEYPVAELGFNAPRVRTFQLVPAMGLGIRGQLEVDEAESDFDAERMASWLQTLVGRHRAFEDAVIDDLNTNPMDDEVMV